MTQRKIEGTVVVTGAGSGLGLAIAKAFLSRGAHVLALAERPDQLAGIAEAVRGTAGDLTTAALDVTAPGRFAFPDDLSTLVNNAGIRLKNLPIEEIALDEWRRYFDVNFFGMVELCRRAVPVMRARGGGTICNISSSSLCWPLPFLGPYRATKGAMSAFSETLRTETRQFGIRILEIMPGSVATGLAPSSISSSKAEAAEVPAYAALAESVHAAFSRAARPPLPPELAAARIVDAIEDGTDRFRYGTDPQSDKAIEDWRSGGGDPGMINWIDAISPAAQEIDGA